MPASHNLPATHMRIAYRCPYAPYIMLRALHNAWVDAMCTCHLGKRYRCGESICALAYDCQTPLMGQSELQEVTVPADLSH